MRRQDRVVVIIGGLGQKKGFSLLPCRSGWLQTTPWSYLFDHYWLESVNLLISVVKHMQNSNMGPWVSFWFLFPLLLLLGAALAWWVPWSNPELISKKFSWVLFVANGMVPDIPKSPSWHRQQHAFWLVGGTRSDFYRRTSWVWLCQSFLHAFGRSIVHKPPWPPSLHIWLYLAFYSHSHRLNGRSFSTKLLFSFQGDILPHWVGFHSRALGECHTCFSKNSFAMVLQHQWWKRNVSVHNGEYLPNFPETHTHTQQKNNYLTVSSPTVDPFKLAKAIQFCGTT